MANCKPGARFVALSPALRRVAEKWAQAPGYVPLQPGEKPAPDRYTVNHYFDGRLWLWWPKKKRPANSYSAEPFVEPKSKELKAPTLSPALRLVAEKYAKAPGYVPLKPGEKPAPDRYTVNHYFDGRLWARFWWPKNVGKRRL